MVFDLDYWQEVHAKSEEKAFEQIFNEVSKLLSYTLIEIA